MMSATTAPAGNGLGLVTRLAWRRSWLFWTVWVLALSSLLPLTVTKYHDLVPPGQDNSAMLTALGANPTMRAILGPAYDLTTAGGFAFFRVGTFTAGAAAMMAVFGVIRATRAEEEAGRLEIVCSGVVARRSPLLGALIVTISACLVTGALITTFMVAAGTPIAGSIATGAGICLTGTMFAGVGAVCAQVFESARSAKCWAAGIVLGGLYLARAMIDATSAGSAVEWLQWFMPLEWAALVRPYADEQWWVLALPTATTALLIAGALWLQGRRDLGAGLRPAGLGRTRARGYLAGSWGLTWRLQRTSLIGWTVGVLVATSGMGTLAHSLGSSATDQVKDMMAKMGGEGPFAQAFYMAMLQIMATMVALMAAIMLHRAHSEELVGHSELMLATRTSRAGYLGGFVASAALSIPVLLAVGALLPLSDGADAVVDYLQAAAALAPGLILVMGLGAGLLGWAPRLYLLVWVVMGWTIFASWVGTLFELPQWLTELTPWGHLPHLPAEPMDWTPVAVETGIGLGLLVLGFVGFRRRDMTGQ